MFCCQLRTLSQYMQYTIGYLHSSYVLHTADRGQMFLEGQSTVQGTLYRAGVFTPEVAWRRFWISKTAPAAICSQPASPVPSLAWCQQCAGGRAAPALQPAGCTVL